LLLEIHHPDQAGQLRLPGAEQAELPRLRADPDFREQVIAHPVDLRQAQRAGEHLGKHAPQPLLKGLGARRLGHLVLADHLLRRPSLVSSSTLPLSARWMVVSLQSLTSSTSTPRRGCSTTKSG